MTAVAAPVLLIGAGKMGGALLKGWTEGGLALGHVAVVEPDAARRQALQKETGVAALADAGALPADFRPGAVVIAVKPQMVGEVLPPYARFAGSDTIFLSIAAGTTIKVLETLLGAGAKVVRAMPNLPAAIGCGMTVACAGGSVSAAGRDRCQALLAAVGEVAWVGDEALMDAVTAVSGSGPAYVFLFVECLAEAAEAAGLDPGLSMDLARATVAGSAKLLDRSTDSPAALRESVTSKGGTTAAALAVLLAGDGLGPLLKKAVAAAAARSRELSR